jgi:drug/metabolite transporter (DMT)-like permease
MALLTALAAAVVYGSSDFLGGLASRRAPVLAVVALSQAAGVVALVPLLVLLPATPTIEALGWGAASGVAGGVGVSLFYRGLSRGRMGVIAPTTAVGAAAVPVLFGLGVGERPGVAALVGIAVALLAIVMVSASPAVGVPEAVGPGVGVATPAAGASAGGLGAGLPDGMFEAIAAGIAFGAFFILLARAGTDSGLWPLVGIRAATITVVLGGALATGRSLRPAPGTWRLIIPAGVFDIAANWLYLLATGTGLLSLVAVATSLYPASTVVLARVVLGERLVRLQLVGLGFAGAGVVLMGLG